MPPTRQAEIIRGAPYFPVPDVSSIGTCYRDILGFRCEYSADDPPEFALYSRDVEARHGEVEVRDTIEYVLGYGQEWPTGSAARS